MKKDNSYIFQSLVIVFMASGFFLFFKAELPNKIFSSEPIVNKNVVIDSLLLQAVQEFKNDSLVHRDSSSSEQTEQQAIVSSTQSPQATLDKDSLVNKQGYLSLEDFDNNSFGFTQGMDNLENFFAKLYQTQKDSSNQVRIAYYGDSMTDGDMIVQDLRRSFQEHFQGSGVGFVPITVESSRSRASITHRYSNNWQVQSYVNNRNPLAPFGVSGQVFFANDSINPTWVSIAAGQIKHMEFLHNPTLYYGKSNNKNAQVEIILGKDTIVKKLTPNASLNRLELAKGRLKNIQVNFVKADSIGFYGIDVGNKQGVLVDNFSSRGNSGLPISLFSASMMHSFDKYLGYDLIILHFGTNVLNYGSYNYSWYTRQMSRVVKHLQSIFPDADILVISTADKSTKYDTTMQSDSAVVPLVNAQMRYAKDNQVAFFNLYKAMGGQGSMIQWVEELPTRANKDYTHFNYRGAQQVANLLYKQIQEGYLLYRKKREASLKEASRNKTIQQENSKVDSTGSTTINQADVSSKSSNYVIH